MNKITVLCLMLLSVLVATPIFAQDMSRAIVKEANGKYILKEKGLIQGTRKFIEGTRELDSSYFAYHVSLPIGTTVKVINTSNMKSVEATVTGRPRWNSKNVILMLNGATASRIFKGSRQYKFSGEIIVETPIDSLLNLLDSSDDKVKADTYLSLARIYEPYEEETALQYLKNAISFAQKSKSLETEAAAWSMLGDMQFEMVERKVIETSWRNNYPRGTEKVINKASKDSGYPKETIARWNHIGGDFYYLRTMFSYSDDIVIYPNTELFSDSSYRHYLKIQEQLQDSNKVVWALKKIGDLQRLKTGYEAAEPYYLRMVSIRENGDSDKKKAWAWGYIADFYWEQKNYEAAGRYFQKLYDLRKSSAEADPVRLIWAMGGLRNLYYSQDKVDEAIAIQSELFPLYKKVGKDRRGSILSVVVYDYLHTFKDREEEVLKALIKWYDEQAEEDYEKDILAQNIAKAFAEKKEYVKAAEYTKAAIDFSESEPERISKINDVAFYYQKGNAFKKSFSFYKKALKIAEEIDNKPLEAIQQYKIAYYYQYREKDKKASSWYEKALKTIKEVPENHPMGYYTVIQPIARIVGTKKIPKDWRISFCTEMIRVVDDNYTKKRFQNILKEIRSE